MASLGQLVLVAGLAFLVLAGQDHGHGGPATAAAAAAPPAREVAVIISQQHPPPEPLSAAAMAASKRVPIPTSGPSDRWNYEVNHEKPAAAAESGAGRRRTRAIDGGRRLLGSSP